MSLGINRFTGKPLSNWDHVSQSLGVLFSTRLFTRVMLRGYGFAVLGLLGRDLTPDVVMRFYMAIVIAVELWEPRFRVTQLAFPIDSNSPSKLQQGQLGIKISGEYRPNALTGDFTPATYQSLTI